MTVVCGNAPARGVRGALRVAAVIAVSFAAFAGPASAQGSDAERQACTPDVFRLCSSEIPNVDRIVACLNRDHAKLSKACRAVMSGTPASRNRSARSDR